jgi:hypothetical protein
MKIVKNSVAKKLLEENDHDNDSPVESQPINFRKTAEHLEKGLPKKAVDKANQLEGVLHEMKYGTDETDD